MKTSMLQTCCEHYEKQTGLTYSQQQLPTSKEMYSSTVATMALLQLLLLLLAAPGAAQSAPASTRAVAQ
jgi:hypothetical protein